MNDVQKASPFDEFWSIYPRREARKAAMKSFEKAAKEDGAESIIDGAKKHVAYWEASGTDRKFIPMPTTYLNQGRYLDPPAEQTSNCELDARKILYWQEKYRKDPALVPAGIRKIVGLGEYANG